jgi:hypothetical protein
MTPPLPPPFFFFTNSFFMKSFAVDCRGFFFLQSSRPFYITAGSKTQKE